MQFSEYQSKALRTKSEQFHAELVDPNFAMDAVMRFELFVKYLDAIKKSLFHGKPLPDDFALRVGALRDLQVYTGPVDSDPLHAILGMMTEIGEISEVVRKIMGTRQVDKVKLTDEIGDLMWYLALLITHYGLDFNHILDRNVAKLQARFPQKFTTEEALNRNDSVEQAAVAG